MYVKVTTSRKVSYPLFYNEDKVNQGKATVLDCVNFFKDPSSLSLEDKLEGFNRLTTLNTQTKVNALHLSLNFHPSENLSNDKLLAIADSYMEEMGFSHQPYIIYRHNDAGHPHIHLVSVNIDTKGKHILMRKSPGELIRARTSIEKKYELINESRPAEFLKQKSKKAHTGKLIYGSSAVHTTIEQILTVVLNQYRFAGIDELNAVLQQYNVFADLGQPHSKMFKMGGIVYRALDYQGKKIGCPIKASSFAMKPTLRNLEKLFEKNAPILDLCKSQIMVKIKWALPVGAISLESFVTAMQKEGIDVSFKRNAEGQLQSLLYIDQTSKAVFSETVLGEVYGANAILNNLIDKEVSPARSIGLSFAKAVPNGTTVYSPVFNVAVFLRKFSSVFTLLFKTGFAEDQSPADLILPQKKKRRKRVY